MKQVWTIAAAVVALLVSGASTAAKTADGELTSTSVLNGQHVRLDMPAGKAKGLAVWFHGQGGTYQTRMNEAWLNSLRVQGWAVASSDFHSDAWGNPAAVDDVKALTDWAGEKAGKAATLYIAGSMGALTSLNSMAQGGPRPKCWYGVMPVVDPTRVANVPKSDEQVRAAYNGVVPASSNPARNLSNLPSGKYRILSSPSDMCGSPQARTLTLWPPG